MNDKVITILVSTLAILTGLLLATITILVLMKSPNSKIKPTINNRLSNIEQEEAITNRLNEVINVMTERDPLERDILINKEDLKMNEGSQYILDGKVLVNGLTYEDIDFKDWEDEDYFYLHLQRSLRQVHLLDTLGRLRVPESVRVTSKDFKIPKEADRALSLYIDNPYLMDMGSTSRLFSSDIQNALMSFLMLYLDQWDLDGVTLTETTEGEEKLFKNKDIEYSFKLHITDEWYYYIGISKYVDSKTGKDRLDQMYVLR